MEINVGDYVRYKEYSYDNEVKIGKKIDTFGNVDTSRGRILEHNIIKHSKDIIVLVEVGDYVNGKLVCNVGKENKYIYLIDFPDLINIKVNDDIKSILTHEQYESNAYKIEKER